MNWIPNIFRRSKIHDDLSEEMRLHIEERTEQLMGEGMSAEEAGRQARVAFGNRTLVEERSRAVWMWPTVESIWGDVRLALRQLRRSPGFTVAAIVTLALAIGANAVVFGVLNSLVLRPVNVSHADSLYVINHRTDDSWESYPNYLDLRDRTRSFDELAAMELSQVALDSGKEPSRIWGFETSANYFEVLNIRPYLGRLFQASDERGVNSAPYIVLSYSYWQSHFQADRNVVGRVVRVNKHPFTIIGVTPPEFRGTFTFFNANFYLPIVNQDQVRGDSELNKRGSRGLIQVLGHLKAGVAPAQAIADLDRVGAGLEKAYPKENTHEEFALGRAGLPGILGRPVRAFVSALTILAGLILLAACANLGSLFAARASDRSREVALRLALGSSRKRILRQLMTESLLISPSPLPPRCRRRKFVSDKPATEKCRPPCRAAWRAELLFARCRRPRRKARSCKDGR